MISGTDQVFQALAQLNEKHTQVSALVARKVFTVAGLRANFQANLKDLAARIARLEPESGDLGKALMSGELAPRKYVDLMRVYWDSLADMERTVTGSSLSFDRVWGEIVLPTWEEAREKAADVANRLPSPEFAVGGFVVVLVLILAIKVA